MSNDPGRLLQTSDGTHRGAFGAKEWTLLAVTSVTWGSSYLWIAIGLESFAPSIVAWLRLALGWAALSVMRRNRVNVDRRDWLRIAIVVVAGNAAPALLFALAEQTIESSVVGMLTAAAPLVTLAMAVALGNRSMRRVHVVALVLGFVGVFVMSWANVVGTDAGIAGIVYVLIAVSGYAVTTNIVGPLTERYGAVAVMWRALALATLVMTPVAVPGLADSTFTLKSFAAVAVLGVFGTGMARSLYAMLIARAGPPRASVVGYLVPVVAVVLGVAVLDESMTELEYVGLGLILVGAFLGSRRIRSS